MSRTSTRLLLLAWLAAAFTARSAHAQSVQPIIVEYGSKAEGHFTVTNNSPDVMAVVFEPSSFSIASDGRGTFRHLDPGIQVELSTMSVRLQPRQSYIVFYKARAESAPAWFTIYATFAPIRHGTQLSLRIQLPHTVYLYQDKPIRREDIHVIRAAFSPARHLLTCELENLGPALGRVQEIEANGPHGTSVSLAGFPLLPRAHRSFTMQWPSDAPPDNLVLHFADFTLKLPPTSSNETPPQTAALASQSPPS